MRRMITISISLAVLAGSLGVGTALASKPSLGCPSTQSSDNRERTYFLVDKEGWWENTVNGIELEEGDDFHVYEGGGYSGTFTAEFEAFAQQLGFASADDVYDYVWVEQWAIIDINDNGWVCMKARPHTPGNPYYFFNGVDDQSSTKNGERT